MSEARTETETETPWEPELDVGEIASAFREARGHLDRAMAEVLEARLALLRAGVPASHKLPTGLDRVVVILKDFHDWYRSRAHGADKVAERRATGEAKETGERDG